MNWYMTKHKGRFSICVLQRSCYRATSSITVKDRFPIYKTHKNREHMRVPRCVLNIKDEFNADWFTQEHKSVLCIIGIEKWPRTLNGGKQVEQLKQ